MNRGALVVDTRTGSVGEVIDTEGPYVRLRPPAGGGDWDCPLSALRPASDREKLRARVAEANAQSRWMR